MCLKRENNWAKTTQQEPLEEFLSNQWRIVCLLCVEWILKACSANK
jgi:hypothetical protein